MATLPGDSGAQGINGDTKMDLENDRNNSQPADVRSRREANNTLFFYEEDDH